MKTIIKHLDAVAIAAVVLIMATTIIMIVANCIKYSI